MSRLLISGFTTAEATIVTSTAIIGGAGGPDSSGVQRRVTAIEKLVVVCGGTTKTANSSGGLKFSYGDSSDVLMSTLVFPTPFAGNYTSAQTPPMGTGPMVVTLDELGIRCRAFKAMTNETAHGGWSIFVFEK